MTLAVDESIADLPPSAKLVWLILKEDGPLTQAQINEKTRLPTRTTRHALERLEEGNLITTRPSITDARQMLYNTYV